ncbi:MAG TPA: choice-of-anchor Q domain-containing protein [Terriglobales bacterium]|nr:choice-of-anchor Q domain-containing protein [Terriglobales bacterium]
MKKFFIGFFLLFGISLQMMAAPNSANLWVDTNGGTCVRQATAGSYVDSQACASIDAAWDLALNGDVIVIKAGTYGSQTISGNKTSPGVTVIGEPGTTIGALATNGAFLTLEDVTVDVGSAHRVGWSTGADNITLKRVNFHGPFFSVSIDTNNITWDGGEFGVAGQQGGQRDFCGVDNEPITLSGANNVTFTNIKFHPQSTISNSACNHMEYIRIDLGGSNFTLRNSKFDPGDGSNTATIFVTNPSGGATYTGLKLENNFFGSNAASSGTLQVHGNISSCSNWTFAYNTYKAYPGAWTCNMTGLWVGNLGAYASSSPCSGTHVKNVWQYNIPGSCGTDKWVMGTAFSTNALGLGGTDGFRLLSGSPAIDAGEAAGYCTSSLGAVDIDGLRRPVGSACDAGASEFGASSSLPPNPPTSPQVTVQ